MQVQHDTITCMLQHDAKAARFQPLGLPHTPFTCRLFLSPFKVTTPQPFERIIRRSIHFLRMNSLLSTPSATSFEALKKEVATLGKSSWRPLLQYVTELHERCIRPVRTPFPYAYEEIGTGYGGSPAFGHWDIVHQILDSLPVEPDHARRQIINNLAAQQEDGLIPGAIYFPEGKPWWNPKAGHPSVWPVAAQEYFELTGDIALLQKCFQSLIRLIGWYEKYRSAETEGFFYTDILDLTWESGVDEGIRFDDVKLGPLACVDATSHLFQLYSIAAAWGDQLQQPQPQFKIRAAQLKTFIQTKLFNADVGFFHDIWFANSPEKITAFEGIWPLVVGAATTDQAAQVIERNLLNPDRFFAPHPISTVALKDPKFELRMWRGPTWNSMTYWAARGCIRYGHKKAAHQLLERALDHTADIFAQTNTIWEFYHPMGGSPLDVQRKPQAQPNQPCRDYLGHNPLVAMTRLWENTSNGS